MKVACQGLPVLVSLSAAAAIGVGVALDRNALPSSRMVKQRADPAASQASPPGAWLTPVEQVALMQAVAQLYLQRKDYTNAIAWAQRYMTAGGSESDVLPLLAHAYYRIGDFANAARELQREVQLAERGGGVPGEDRLLLLLKCYTQLGDSTASAWALEKLLSDYPRREYWADLLDRMQRRSNVGPEHSLDINRLRLLTRTLGGASGYLAMAAQARQAGFPAEARRVVDRGIADGVLGRGPDAAGHRRLQRQLACEALAQQRRIKLRGVELAAERSKDGIELFNLGFARTTLADTGKGLTLMEMGLRKGRFAGRPQYARLHLGIAYLMAGDKASAIEAFQRVGGRHATAEIARLWILYALHSPT